MRIFYKILIILFVALSLFLLKDDIKSTIKNISSYFNKSNNNSLIQLIDKKELQLPSKVDIPGALRVVDNLLNSNGNTKLSTNNVILLTNKYRKENGNLSALKENQQLVLSAEKKLQDMFTNQYFEHISPNNIGITDLSNQVGYEYILIGENLAMGNFKDDASLVDAWMASPGHRANILNEHYTEIGVAVDKGVFEGKNIWMAVQHFGTPRSVCPYIDQVLFEIININQNQIKEKEADLILKLDNIDKGIIHKGSTYREQVKEYNNLINIYNNLIKDIEQKINDYNNQIRAFNLCILNNQ